MIKGLHIGSDAIERLRVLATSGLDAGASSHWQDRLNAFKLEQGMPTGYRGFGAMTPRKMTRAVGHYTMQTPYRVMGLRFPKFRHFTRVARRIARAQDRAYDYDLMRQVFTAACCEPHFPQMEPGALHYVIGDGFGSLTTLLLEAVAGSRVALANLTPVLLVDLLEISRIIGQRGVALVETAEAAAAAAGDPQIRVIAVTADNHQVLAGLRVGFVYNTASMGEMNGDVVASYFDVMRRFPTKTLFYNANRDEKVLPDGTISRVAEYPWHRDDIIIFEGRPDWYRFFYFYMPPRYVWFTGKMSHRLCVMAKTPPGTSGTSGTSAASPR